jgi:AcrR family transcriptional regulator
MCNANAIGSFAMSEPALLQLPPRSRPRRSQAERTAETRARILAATVESIDEIGLQRTTASEITRRSGVTWGAVQHHYGDKEGILAAVLEDSFARFAERLTGAAARFGTGSSIRERIDVFIDRAWAHFASPHYRATFEILLHQAGPSQAEDGASWQHEMLQAWQGVWQSLFPDLDLPRRQLVMLQHYTISTLSGLASMRLLSREANRFVPAELALLKHTLGEELEPSAARSGRTKRRTRKPVRRTRTE